MNAITLTHTGNEPRVDSRQLAKQLGTKATKAAIVMSWSA